MVVSVSCVFVFSALGSLTIFFISDQAAVSELMKICVRGSCCRRHGNTAYLAVSLTEGSSLCFLSVKIPSFVHALCFSKNSVLFLPGAFVLFQSLFAQPPFRPAIRKNRAPASKRKKEENAIALFFRDFNRRE